MTLRTLCVTLALALSSILSVAQAPPPAGPVLDLATARKIAAATEAAANAQAQHISLCILDASGDVLLWEHLDGAKHMPIVTSAGKARAALLFGRPTGEIAAATQESKPVTATLTANSTGELTIQRGGLPIFLNGKLVGAIGVGGSSSENDEKLAQTGLDTLTAK